MASPAPLTQDELRERMLSMDDADFERLEQDIGQAVPGQSLQVNGVLCR